MDVLLPWLPAAHCPELWDQHPCRCHSRQELHLTSRRAPPPQVYEVLDTRGRPVTVPPGSLGVSRGPVELVFGGKGVGPDLHKVKVRGGAVGVSACAGAAWLPLLCAGILNCLAETAYPEACNHVRSIHMQ